LPTPYIIYAQIGTCTNRQTFNKNIATAEKYPIFTSHKSLYKHVVPNADKPPAAQIAHLFFFDAKANAPKNKRAIFCQRSE